MARLRLKAGFEDIIFPNDERIDKEYRGKTVVICYNLPDIHVGGFNGPKLSGYTREFVLSYLKKIEEPGF